MVNWVKLLSNQGPDPSLVYRPDVDPELAQSKDSFRNYTVSEPTLTTLTFSARSLVQPCGEQPFLFPQL